MTGVWGGQGRTLEGSSEETMRVLRGSKVALDESVFLAGMYKYKDKPFFPRPCPVLLATNPARFPHWRRQEGKSKLSSNCDQTHIHQLLDLLCYYRVL